MVKCPKCNKEIEGLNQTRSGTETSFFYVDKGEKYCTYDNESFDSDGDYYCYQCPECGEELFSRYEDAEKFMLSNNDDLAELIKETIDKKKNGNTKK